MRIIQQRFPHASMEEVVTATQAYTLRYSTTDRPSAFEQRFLNTQEGTLALMAVCLPEFFRDDKVAGAWRAKVTPDQLQPLEQKIYKWLEHHEHRSQPIQAHELDAHPLDLNHPVATEPAAYFSAPSDSPISPEELKALISPSEIQMHDSYTRHPRIIHQMIKVREGLKKVEQTLGERRGLGLKRQPSAQDKALLVLLSALTAWADEVTQVLEDDYPDHP